MSFIWAIIVVLLALVWLVSVWDIVRRHLGGGRTAAWLLIVILLPFAGALLYWMLRRPTDDEVRRKVEMDGRMRHGP